MAEYSNALRRSRRINRPFISVRSWHLGETAWGDFLFLSDDDESKNLCGYDNEGSHRVDRLIQGPWSRRRLWPE